MIKEKKIKEEKGFLFVRFTPELKRELLLFSAVSGCSYNDIICRALSIYIKEVSVTKEFYQKLAISEAWALCGGGESSRLFASGEGNPCQCRLFLDALEAPRQALIADFN